jgi:hypothetical protein
MTQAPKHNKQWTDAEDTFVDDTTGVPVPIVAGLLGRSDQAISNRRWVLGCPRKTRNHAQTAALKSALAARDDGTIHIQGDLFMRKAPPIVKAIRETPAPKRAGLIRRIAFFFKGK